jgi:hypothetical protein
MKSNRNLSRGEGRRLGNVALIAFMLGSLLLLSLVRARLSPIGNHRRVCQILVSWVGIRLSEL